MKQKKGGGWCAWDDENGRCFGEYGGTMAYHLYELTKEQYDKLNEQTTEYDASKIMYDGRHLYMSVDDRCGPPYTIVFDNDYEKLCPWAKVMGGGKVWPDELTDAAVEIFASEENNRQQRRKKRKEQNKKDITMIHENYGINKEGNLTVCGADTVQLAAKYGTPLYVLDEDKVREQCRIYKNATKKYFPSGSMPFFASKALSYVGIYRIIAEEGLGTDLVSPGELYTAAKAGFPLQNSCFHGNNKTDADIEYGVKSGVGYFVVDSTEELHALSEIAVKLGKVQRILLRLSPGIDPHTFEAVKTGRVDSKFGSPIATGAAEQIVKEALSLDGVKLCGYHCHIGSQIFESEPFCGAAKIMMQFCLDMKEKYGFEADIINLGGGFGVSYYEEQKDPDIDGNIKEIADVINGFCAEKNIKVPVIFMEPGRSIVGAAGVTLYTVGSVKEIPGFRSYVSIDGGMPDNPRYALYASRYTALIANKADKPCTEEYTVAGRCCESGDLIGEKMLMQKAKRGDILAVLVTGAYNYSMASHYNRIPKPPIVTVSGGKDTLAVKRESYEDLTRNEI